jgi:serine/threonine-protein kinase
MGTPYYMSPEQCRGMDVDRGTDVYAFGALVFEVLTGRVPFIGESPMDVLLKHMTVEPPCASEVCPEVPPQLDAPIRRMLAKEPSARPASVGEALESLVSAGNAAGALSGVAPLPPPSHPAVVSAAVSSPTAIGETMADASLHSASPVRVITADPVVAGNGSTFLGAEADIAPSHRSRVGLVVAVAVFALGLGALVVVIALGHKPDSPKAAGLTSAPTALVPATSALATTPSAAPSIAPASDVELRVEGAPKDARVSVGNKELGVVPGPFTVKANEPLTLTVSAKGWKSRDVSVTPTAPSATIEVALEKQGPPAKVGPKGKPISSDLEGFDK